MMKVIRDFFTTADGEGWELGRALWCLSVLALLAYQGIAIFFNEQDFEPIEFGTAAAAILAAGGFGIRAKDQARTQALETRS